MGLLSSRTVDQLYREKRRIVPIPEYDGETYVGSIPASLLVEFERIHSQMPPGEMRYQDMEPELARAIYDMAGRIAVAVCIDDDGQKIFNQQTVERLTLGTRIDIMNVAISYLNLNGEIEERAKNFVSPT